MYGVDWLYNWNIVTTEKNMSLQQGISRTIPTIGVIRYPHGIIAAFNLAWQILLIWVPIAKNQGFQYRHKHTHPYLPPSLPLCLSYPEHITSHPLFHSSHPSSHPSNPSPHYSHPHPLLCCTQSLPRLLPQFLPHYLPHSHPALMT